MAVSLSPEQVEREYNNRALVPEHPAIFARWERDSEYVRGTLPCHIDVPYGEDPRHRMDLFPAQDARGTLVFIHGGYWRSLDKRLFSWIAPSWVAEGVNVALPNYRLCPAVSIEDIVSDALAALHWLFEDGPRRGIAMQRVLLAGHSAGGHLTAAILAAPREHLRFDTRAIAGAAPISGIFDFTPMRHFSFNADFRLDEAAVARLDLAARRPTIPAPLVVAVGGNETSEFRRQSRLLADAWGIQLRALQLLPGLNHFTVLDALAERGQPLHRELLACLG